jgi:predicted double-glycine peptidase
MTGLPIFLNILILLFFSFLGFLESKRLFNKNVTLETKNYHKKSPLTITFLVILLLLLISQLILCFSPSLFWKIPLIIEYYYIALLWGILLSILTFIFSLNITLSILTKHPKRLKFIIAAVLLIIALQIFFSRKTISVIPYLKEEQISDGVVLQTSGYSCAPAVCASIARLYGINKNEKDMAIVLKTTVDGTDNAHIIYGMQELGFRCKKINIKDLNHKKIKPPAMIFVDHPVTGPESHAVGYMGYNNKEIEIWDPLVGKTFTETILFKKIWHGRGIEFQKN